MATAVPTLERDSHATAIDREGEGLRGIGRVLLTLTLATIFVWIGAMKFTDYKAQGVNEGWAPSACALRATLP